MGTSASGSFGGALLKYYVLYTDANIGSNHCSRVLNPILTMSWYSIKNPQKWPHVRMLANLSKICLETHDSR